MQPVEVTARFGPDGKIIPLRFRWQGGLYPVESTGRRWQVEDGYHILVMTAGGRMFELLFIAQENRWYLAQAGGIRMPA
jgi:hypothetical protein